MLKGKHCQNVFSPVSEKEGGLLVWLGFIPLERLNPADRNILMGKAEECKKVDSGLGPEMLKDYSQTLGVQVI